MSPHSNRRIAAVLLGAISAIIAFVASTPWPIGFGAAVAAAACWCVWLEREARGVKLLRFPDVRSVRARPADGRIAANASLTPGDRAAR